MKQSQAGAVIHPAPVRRSVEVAADPDRAFRLFTAGMGRWWARSHSIGKSPQVDVVIEPREGGRWYEVGADGSTCEWGGVLEWDPPHRVLLRWGLTAEWRHDPDFRTEVEVTFTALPGRGTRVTLEHRGLEAYGAAAEGVAASLGSPGGWGGLLAAFAASAEG